ncbi:uS9 family ribosomal protein [Bifidobacterium xylocopae]|uniref:hypothetical protein n=1 Tax=Bifidobacterium xylocopae TaxID=2493119 RepID=UPI001374CFEA
MFQLIHHFLCQAEVLRPGVAGTLNAIDPDANLVTLKKAGFLTCDAVWSSARIGL